MWVADMDFRSPPAVIEALHQHVEHGVFGYTEAPEELIEVIISRLKADCNWQIQPEWIVWLPGLVTGLNVACRAVGKDGDDVMTIVPAYPPFLSAPKYSGRNLITVELKQEQNRWGFDFDQIENSITPKTRLFVLCNPHNPAGRVFTRQELDTLCEICQKHEIIICSDEIHCGLVLDENKKHIPTAILSPEIEDRTITLMAPSKTFNLPGLGCSFAIISNERLRRDIRRAMSGIVPFVNTLGFTAALAAYRDSREWHSALLAYLRKNRETLEQFIESIPGLSMSHVEATYMGWIDTSAAGLKNPAQFFENAGVGLSDGTYFNGPGFVRLNFGCSHSMLLKALRRMGKALGSVLPGR